MSKISIKNQEDRNDVMVWVSDLFKDVNGFRPRGYKFNEWSNQELEDFVMILLRFLKSKQLKKELGKIKPLMM